MVNRILTGAVGILLLATLSAAQPGRVIHGQVFDAQTGAPLPGANVFIVPGGLGTASDATGYFKLTFSDGAYDSLRVRFMGYRTFTAAISQLSSELQIKLQPTTVLFREVVITATRQLSPAAQVPITTEVIDIAAPAHASQQTAGEILAEAQSVFIQDQGSLNSLKTVTLRGAKASQVLVLQDNFRLNNPQNGLVDLSTLPLLGIDRIEVARGSSSAQYGSDAIGGVIHLRTLPPPNGFSGQVEYTLGDFGTDIKRVRLGHAAGPYSVVLGYGLVRSEGDFKINEASEKRQNNALDRREIYLRAAASFSSKLRATAFHQNVDNEQGVPGSLHFPSTTAQQKDNNHLTGLGVEWRQNKLLQLTAQASWQKLDQIYSEPAFDFRSHHEGDGLELILHNRSHVQRDLDLLYGVELTHYALQSTDLGKPQRDQRSAFIQAEWRYGYAQRNCWYEWLLMPAVRFDDYSDAGQRLTPKLGLAWRRVNSIGITARANIGQSFRVPNLNELYWPSSSYYSGNPDLKPETGANIDGGFVLQIPYGGNWQVEANGFSSTLDNLIIDTPDANGRLSPKNLETAKLRGLEAALAWHSTGDQLTLKIAHTYLRATNETAGNRGKLLTYRPQSKLDANVGLVIAQIHLNAAYQFVGKRFIDSQNNKSLPAYRLINFAIGRQWRWGALRAQTHAEVRNVFDKHFSILDGYPMPGREFRATVRLGN